MLKAERVQTYGWQEAIRGMRNPMNSWEMQDTVFTEDYNMVLGDNDLALMKKLVKAGTDHRKFLRMITVYMDITAPLYWWKEYDTYKVGTVANSCSTMHKIQEKEFILDDFSHEHLDGSEVCIDNLSAWDVLYRTIKVLNFYRDKFNETHGKKYWWQMIQLLPSSYNQKRTVMLNYEVLRNIYHARKNHKLDEWHTLCAVIEKLPYFEVLIA